MNALMGSRRNSLMTPAAFVPPAGDVYRDFDLENYWLDYGRGGDYRGDSEWALRLPRIRESVPERFWPESPLLPLVPYPINPRARTPMTDPTDNDVPWQRPRGRQGIGY